MNYQEAMKYITEVGNFGSNYGLERTYRLLELLDNPQNKIKVIHVAGTNGKGSTTSMISKILSGTGYKVGMYTSPYLEEFEERIQINGINIPKDRLALEMTKVRVAVEKVIEEGYNHPTEFEIITVLMYLYFANEQVDFAVVEVGLGGRLDSTNVITPILSVITSISFDHTNLLGNTLSEIAAEKAGIIKFGVPVVLYPQEKEVEKLIEEKCCILNSELYKVSKDDVKLLEIIKGNKPMQKVLVSLNEEYTIDLPLLGEHQIYNLALALKVVEIINGKKFTNISKEIIKESLKDVRWNGRLEVLKSNPLVVIDGAHNIQGINQLSTNVKKYFNYENMYLILGILADKDVEHMVNTIAPMAKKVYTVTPNSIRAEDARALKEEVLKVNKNCEAFDDYEEAYKAAMNDASADDIVLASGSLYMIGAMRTLINKLS